MQSTILRHALPLVRTHGFTRQALSFAALSLPTPHAEPLSETAVSSLFGPGDEARKTLIQAWLEEGIDQMGRKGSGEKGEKIKGSVPVRDALLERLEWNEPVLERLPEAFALLSLPQTSIPLPFLDPRPAVSHSMNIANEACFLAGDVSIGTSWYSQRASLAVVYTAAGLKFLPRTDFLSLTTCLFTELHQLTSPRTVVQFLDALLESSGRARGAVADAGDFANYVLRSWAGIIKSRGLV